jgi:copper chaperone CopZ
MDVATFAVPSVARESEAMDLRNAINSLSGVAVVHFELASHTCSVHYDSSHLSHELLLDSIKGTGYGPAEGR